MGNVNKGEWQTKVYSLNPEMEWNAGPVLVVVAQIHPKTKREGPLFHFWNKDANIPVPYMAAALLPVYFPFVNLENRRDPTKVCDRCAQVPQ